MAYREDYANAGSAEVIARELRTPSRPGAPQREPARPESEKPPAEIAEKRAAAPAPPPAEPAKAEKPARPWKKLILFAVLAGGLGFGGLKGHDWWTHGRFMVSTDDAYLQADMTILSAKVSGYIAAMEVANNQPVKAGDVIARIDDGDYRLAVQAARDKLATQQSAVARIGRQIEAAKAGVTQAAAQIDAVKADALRTVSDYARQTQLAQSDYTSRARLEQSRADRDRAEATVRSAEAALAAARANVDVLAAQQTEASRLAAELQTAVERAERDLSFTILRAPLDGVVGNKAAEVGTYVQPGTRLAALVPLSGVHVDANFKETQLASVKPGQKAHIEVDAYPGRDFVGTIESVSPASGSVFSLLPPENATGNFTKIVQRVPVRVRISAEEANEGVLRPGLSVVVSVDRRDRPEAAPIAVSSTAR